MEIYNQLGVVMETEACEKLKGKVVVRCGYMRIEFEDGSRVIIREGCETGADSGSYRTTKLVLREKDGTEYLLCKS